MFELPEMTVLARQMNETIKNKIVKKGVLGNTPHKFVWYNRTHNEFGRLTVKKKIGDARVKGRWLFIPLKPGYVLVLGEFGGKVLYHPARAEVPEKYHLWITFEDSSFLTATTQMWGAVELYEEGKEEEGKYVKGMRTTPVEASFTFNYFNELIDNLKEKKSAKGILTQDQLIPGLGNAIAQDILFQARLHPRHPVGDMTKTERKRLYNAIKKTVDKIIKKSGRYDEYDLHNKPGKYVRLMDKNAVGRPCPNCGGKVKKTQYLGGACYFCAVCQK